MLLAFGCSGTAPEAPAEVAEAPAAAGGPTVRVYPGVRDIPANGLTFLLEWSEPMQLGPHASVVLDAHGEPVPGAIRRLAWDEPMRTAVVKPEGLVAGRLYTLKVAGFSSQEGVPAAEIEQAFVVRPEDHEAPSGKDLQVTGRPDPGSASTLSVAFPEPIQGQSLQSLTVLAKGEPIDGRWELADGDAVARFTPAAPWPEGPVHVALGAGIVDLGGNELTDRPMGMLSPVPGP
jgi:hypothetical protein